MEKALSLKKDLIIFLCILVVVLGLVGALYWYNQQSGVIDDFSGKLFAWLIE